MQTSFLAGRGNARVLHELASSSNDVTVILNHYTIPSELQHQLKLLVQVRHEILHPAHRPSGDVGNTPAYLEPLRRANLLQSTGGNSDYIWLEQLKSHRLLRWGFETVKQTVVILVEVHQIHPLEVAGLIASYSDYEPPDAA